MALTPKQRIAETRRQQKESKITELKSRGGLFKKKALEKEFETAKPLAGGVEVSTVTGRTKTPVTSPVTTPNVLKEPKKFESAQQKEVREKKERALTQAEEAKLTPLELAEKEAEVQKRADELEARTFEEQKSSLERKIGRATRQADIRSEKIKRETAGQLGATTERFATGREGATATTAEGLKTEFRSEIEKRAESQLLELDAFRQSIEDQKLQLARAVEAKDIQAQERLNKSIAKLQELEAERAGEQDEERKQALQGLSFLQGLSPSSIAGISEDELGTLFDQAGIPTAFATAFLSENAKLSEAQAELVKDPTNIDKQNTVLALEGKIDKIKTEASGVTKQEEFAAGIQRLVAKGTLTQEQADKAIAEELGIGVEPEEEKFQAVKVGDDVYSFNPKTGEFERKVGESSNGNLVPTGQTATSVFNGKNVELDTAALASFAGVNATLVSAGLGEINIGSVADSSTRKQADTISRMAERFGIGFNAENPNETAAELRALGHQVANVGNSMHEKGLAVDIFPDPAYIAQVKPFLEKAGWKQTIPNGDAGHFEFQGVIAEDESKKIANEIFKGVSNLTIAQLKQNKRPAVEAELNKLRQDAISQAKLSDNPGDLVKGAMRASAGGKVPDSTFTKKFGKTASVINQVSQLQSLLLSGDKSVKDAEGTKLSLSPLTGWLKQKNPWSLEGAQVNAALQGTIPNLARGVFGEVGVLTDRDVELYRKTLPNLSQPEEIRKSVLALTLRTLRNSLDFDIRAETGTGKDLSGLEGLYGDLDDTIVKMEEELGIIGKVDRLGKFDTKKNSISRNAEKQSLSEIRAKRNQ